MKIFSAKTRIPAIACRCNDVIKNVEKASVMWVVTLNMIFQEHRFFLCPFSILFNCEKKKKGKFSSFEIFFFASPDKSFRSDWSCNWQMAKAWVHAREISYAENSRLVKWKQNKKKKLLKILALLDAVH